jgi:hypothetical protein
VTAASATLEPTADQEEKGRVAVPEVPGGKADPAVRPEERVAKEERP